MNKAKKWIHILRTGNLPLGQDMDWVSKWLIITRACVFTMTLLSAGIGILLAMRDSDVRWMDAFLVVTGLLLAHAANNMVNDFFDQRTGVDTEEYPRAAYAPHPLLHHLVSKEGLLAAILLCNVADLIIAVKLSLSSGWPVMGFAVAGLFLSVAYVAPPFRLKARGWGEAAIFLIWGPLMTVGTYYVLARQAPMGVWLASIPYGLAVTTVILGKHLDKADMDSRKGIRTLPVLLGKHRALAATEMLVWGFYLTLAFLAGAALLPKSSLLVFFSLPQATRFLQTLRQDMPRTPSEAFEQSSDCIPKDLRDAFNPSLEPSSYPLWPLWYVVWSIWWVRQAGAWFLVGLLLASWTG